MVTKQTLVKLNDKISYDPVRDSYQFTTDRPEKLGPISVGLQITRRCNANCIHCAASALTTEVNTESMLNIIERLHEGGCVRLSVTGGEPLVRDDILLLLKKMDELGMAVTLSTNGFALTEEKIEQFKPYLTNIRFSLHGLEKANDYVFQKKGAFKHILKQIDHCIAHGLSVGVIFTIMQLNMDDFLELVQLLDKRGVHKLLVFTLMAVGRGEDIYDDQLVTAPEMNKFLLQFEKIKREKNLKIEVNLVDWRLEGQCLLVDPTGLMFGYDPTSAGHVIKIGNVLEEPVKQLWRKYPYKKNYINYYISH